MKRIISSLLAAILAISTLLTYVLVHGSWQAPFVGDAVRDELQKTGNKVIVVELPGQRYSYS